MTVSVSWWDRLRVECLVWALDQRLYDLPTRKRVATRREVRANLLSAAAEVGVSEALRRVGSSRQLARLYLDAEFGDRPHPAWIAAAYFCALSPLMLNYLLDVAADAFAAGVQAATPSPPSQLTWSGIQPLQNSVFFVFADGHATQTGGAWTPWCYLALVAGTVLAGRLWRVFPWWGRHRIGARELA